MKDHSPDRLERNEQVVFGARIREILLGKELQGPPKTGLIL
jgi:hypothetical protein